MSKTKKDYELLMTEEGHFFFGRLLKNGTMSADSVPVEEDQVMNMFAAWFMRYCRQGNTDTLWLSLADGALLVKHVSKKRLVEAVAHPRPGRKRK